MLPVFVGFVIYNRKYVKIDVTAVFTCLLCVSFVDVYQFVCVLLSPFVFEGGMWDLII